MSYVIGLIAFILVLSIIVIIHEMGHFLMARRAKILCYEFSIGMGPLIWKKKKGETVYAIRCIPIGGFVSMAGEEIEQDFLKDIKQVKLELDENQRITRIICDVNDEKFKDLVTYDLGTYDLSGTKEGLPDELYLCTKDENGEWRYEVDKVERNCCVVFFAYNNNSCFKIADNSVNDIDDKAYIINEETAVCQLSDDELDLIDSVWYVDTKKGTILKMTD